MRVGIIGAGWIATKAAITLCHLTNVEAYAIASRTLARAQEFA
ncbi:MAG: gfo/Idh/MocA family oxidoreductase, partial [Bacteroidaceae bacterium]|nr:gfo/Idh/MocA family oxidoreductase [Bacteroidaceae bacterium]MBQ7482957.1 gfo/Idh/MocA family oxidoreductase [Bacteroidaceae bacterium]